MFPDIYWHNAIRRGAHYFSFRFCAQHISVSFSCSHQVQLLWAILQHMRWIDTDEKSHHRQRVNSSVVPLWIHALASTLVSECKLPLSHVQYPRNLWLILIRPIQSSNVAIFASLLTWSAASCSAYSCWNDRPCYAILPKGSVAYLYTTTAFLMISVLCTFPRYDTGTRQNNLMIFFYTFASASFSSWFSPNLFVTAVD